MTKFGEITNGDLVLIYFKESRLSQNPKELTAIVSKIETKVKFYAIGINENTVLCDALRITQEVFAIYKNQKLLKRVYDINKLEKELNHFIN